jgi:hypothetical protein
LREPPQVGAAFTRNIYADPDGQWHSFSPVERPVAGILEAWLERIASGQRTTTPAVVVRRSAYETLGGFDETLGMAGEDWEMWVRIATRFPVWFEPTPLAVYRMERPNSLTESKRHTTWREPEDAEKPKGASRLALRATSSTSVVKAVVRTLIKVRLTGPARG